MRGGVKNTIKVLMIEDDSAQTEALKEALIVAQIICVEIHEAEDGEQAMAFLHQEYPFMDAPQPDLIFLSNHPYVFNTSQDINPFITGIRPFKQMAIVGVWEIWGAPRFMIRK